MLSLTYQIWSNNLSITQEDLKLVGAKFVSKSAYACSVLPNVEQWMLWRVDGKVWKRLCYTPIQRNGSPGQILYQYSHQYSYYMTQNYKYGTVTNLVERRIFRVNHIPTKWVEPPETIFNILIKHAHTIWSTATRSDSKANQRYDTDDKISYVSNFV